MSSENGKGEQGQFASWFDANRAQLLGELGELIRIPSVSALPRTATT
jgi:hypothetical protein